MADQNDRKAQDSPSEAESELEGVNLQEIKNSIKYLVHRPGWIAAATIWIAASALIGIWGGADALAKMSGKDWAAAAADLGVGASTFRLLYAIEASWMIVTGLAMLASIVGIWRMKKWGTTLYVTLVMLIAAGQVWKVVQGRADLVELFLAASLVVLGLGLTRLRRTGELL